MKIYIEQSADNVVDIVDWGAEIDQPADTDVVDNVDGFNDQFELDQRIRYNAGGSRWDAMNDEDVPFYTETAYVTRFTGRQLLYEKDTGIVYFAKAADENICLELTTDATDTADPIDGIPDIEANGISTCTITIKKVNGLGEYMTDAADDDTIDLKCTRGNLSALRVDLVNGEASVTLTSTTETCVSGIYAESQEEAVNEAKIQIQFAP